jgi:hypothetical protein
MLVGHSSDSTATPARAEGRLIPVTQATLRIQEPPRDRRTPDLETSPARTSPSSHHQVRVSPTCFARCSSSREGASIFVHAGHGIGRPWVRHGGGHGTTPSRRIQRSCNEVI